MDGAGQAEASEAAVTRIDVIGHIGEVFAPGPQIASLPSPGGHGTGRSEQHR